MARRRKKNRKVSAPRTRQSTAVEKLLRRHPDLAARLNNPDLVDRLIDLDGLDLDIFDDDDDDDIPPPAELVPNMLGAANSCLVAHKPLVRKKAEENSPTFEFTQVDPEGLIEALVIANRGNMRRVSFTVNYGQQTFGVACSCGHSMCVHSYQLMQEIMRQLETPDSELRKKFPEAKLTDPVAEEQQRERDTALRMLGRLKPVAPVHTKGLDELDVPDIERVAWNLSVNTAYGHTDVSLKPIRQKQKKNGGWTKGREISLQGFMEMPRHCWSEADRALESRTQRLQWYPNYQLSLKDALPALAGSDSFLLDKEPAELNVSTFEISVIDIEGGWRLSTSVLRIPESWGEVDSSLIITAEDGAVVVCRKLSRVTWIPMTPEQKKLCRHLAESYVVFATDHRELLMEHLEQLSSVVPVALPPSLGGEELPAEVQPCLLLQMKKSGAMDATVCIREPQQMLVLPGEGLMRRHDTLDDRPVQYVRNAESERQLCQGIARELSLARFPSVRDWTWQVEDADEVVQLLTFAGEMVDNGTLTIIWHRASAQQFDIVGRLTTANVSVKVSRQRDWFGVDGMCQVGDQEVPLRDLLHGLRAPSALAGFVELQPGKWAAIADELRATLQRLADVTNDSRGKLQMDASAAMAVSAIEDQALDIEADKAWQKCMTKVRSIEQINPDPPASLNCDLRDYQVEGFRWMCRLAEWGVGGILADDMGLGKTVQTLAVLLQRLESGPALVIAPTSLGFNWEQECRRFAPSLTPRLLREADRAELIASASEGDVIICSYGLALRETELLQSIHWGTLVLDEAQNIKNSNSKTAKEIRKLGAEWKVALTGTPMENHLGELWSIFRAISPGVLGSWEQFRKKFAGPIEKENDNERRQALSRVISPFVLRRAKKEVLNDLPDRSESNLLIELSPEERRRYDQVRLAAVGELDELGDTELSGDQRFKVLQLLTRLRQLACHVGLIDENWTAGSSKLTMLMEQLEELKEHGSRPLIFSQFTSHLALIREACDQRGISYQYLDGQTTPKARQQRVEAFQNGEGDAFLISLKAGGTGLNLTAADYVIHMDPWWNPAVEDQATDRAHRIGQQNHVMVYRIIAKDTIEEQILSLHEDKRDLVEGVLSGAEASAKLSTEELAALIRNQGSVRSGV
ncbi:MAG: DEAD/DEAH box helicase [Fuerstiella sp.]